MRFPSHATGPEHRPGTAPDGMPEPRPYGHLAPEDGACLMETASVLAAEPFTDSPHGTDPALAALARTVYDAVADRARGELAPLAAELAAARPADRGFTAGLVAATLHAARDVRPSARSTAVREARCRARSRRLAGAPGGAFAAARDAVWWSGPGRHHLEHALRILLRAPDAEKRLVRLLRESVAAAKRAAGSEARGAAGSPRSPQGVSRSSRVG